MPNYKSPDNAVHFLDSVEFEYLLPDGSIQITDEEAEAIRIANAPVAEPEPVIDPVEKLRSFLASNPDVAAIL